LVIDPLPVGAGEVSGRLRVVTATDGLDRGSGTDLDEAFVEEKRPGALERADLRRLIT